MKSTMYPRIIREFDDHDEPMYYGDNSWLYYLDKRISHAKIVLQCHLQISKRN